MKFVKSVGILKIIKPASDNFSQNYWIELSNSVNLINRANLAWTSAHYKHFSRIFRRDIAAPSATYRVIAVRICRPALHLGDAWLPLQEDMVTEFAICITIIWGILWLRSSSRSSAQKSSLFWSKFQRLNRRKKLKFFNFLHTACLSSRSKQRSP